MLTAGVFGGGALDLQKIARHPPDAGAPSGG